MWLELLSGSLRRTTPLFEVSGRESEARGEGGDHVPEGSVFVRAWRRDVVKSSHGADPMFWGRVNWAPKLFGWLVSSREAMAGVTVGVSSDTKTGRGLSLSRPSRGRLSQRFRSVWLCPV